MYVDIKSSIALTVCCGKKNPPVSFPLQVKSLGGNLSRPALTKENPCPADSIHGMCPVVVEPYLTALPYLLFSKHGGERQREVTQVSSVGFTIETSAGKEVSNCGLAQL